MLWHQYHHPVDYRPYADNAVVSTLDIPSFSVDTTGTGGNAVTITGDGALSYTDANASPLTAAVTALDIRSNDGGTPGSIMVETNGTLTGASIGGRGINADNYGSGALSITANGDVSGNTGIDAYNAGTNLSVTTGAGTTVIGGADGIRASNNGNGALDIRAYGHVEGTFGFGIRARNNNGTNLSVTTGAGTNIIGRSHGIYANNGGNGTLTVTVNGNVEGTGLAGGTGIFATNSTDGAGVSVTTSAGSNVSTTGFGLIARNFGNGSLTVTVNGDVESNTRDAISVRNSNGPIDMTIGSGSTVTSGGTGSHFAIDIDVGVTNLTVAGTLNGGAGGAIRFDQVNAVDNRLELHPTATIDGNVFAGPGTGDTLVFGGSGDGDFDLSDIDVGGNTQQYRNFEIFQVDSGTWSLSGATTQAFTINGGTVGGTGTFNDLTVNGGTLAPGNSIGTIIVNGAFTLSAGAIYEVEVNAAGEGDQVIVNGTVNLTGATLRVLAANGGYALKTDYVIIDKEGTNPVTGTFATITSSLAFLEPTVIYNGGTGNDVVLTLIRNDSDFCSVARTRNQCNVAMALDRFPTGNDLFLAVLNQTASGARQAFDALSGEIHATLAGVLADDSRYVREAIMGRLMQAGHGNNSLGAGGPQVASLDSQAMALGYDGKSLGEDMLNPGTGPAFWTRAYGAWGDYDGNRNAATADRDLGGFISGMDASVGGSWRIGLAAGASYSNIDVSGRNSSADVESFHLAGYVGGMAGAFALRGGGAWAWNDIDTSRAVIFPGVYERQKASYDADTGQVFGEIAYPTAMGGMAVEPFAGLAYVSVDTDRFVERGGALASLTGRNTDQDVGYSTLGLRAASTMHWGDTLVTPHVSVAWQHAFDDVTPGAALAFASTGIGFDITGVPLAKDSALIDAGLDFALGERTSAGVSYSGQFGDGVQDNAVKGRFAWLF